jgi:hypothetical protein
MLCIEEVEAMAYMAMADMDNKNLCPCYDHVSPWA